MSSLIGNSDGTISTIGFADAVSTTDATVTTLSTRAITADTINFVEAKVVARDTGAGAGASYIIRARIKDVGGTTTAHDVTAEYTSEDVAGWDATIDVNANDMRIRVTGAAATNIDWQVFYELRTLS